MLTWSKPGLEPCSSMWMWRFNPHIAGLLSFRFVFLVATSAYMVFATYISNAVNLVPLTNMLANHTGVISASERTCQTPLSLTKGLFDPRTDKWGGGYARPIYCMKVGQHHPAYIANPEFRRGSTYIPILFVLL